MHFAYAFDPGLLKKAREVLASRQAYAYPIVVHRDQAPSTVLLGRETTMADFPNVRCMKQDLEELFRGSGGAIRRADHPKFQQRLDRLYREGVLERPLPGIFALPGTADAFHPAVIAGALWAGPDAVLVGRAAAKLTFWQDLLVDDLEFTIGYRRRVRVKRWVKSFRRIPDQFVWQRGPIRLTSPALTAVDLAAGPKGGDVIDRVLREGAASLDHLWQAFYAQPDRLGNPIRRTLLEDSRDEPWSEAERELHRLLRGRKVTGWKTNRHIRLAGRNYYADLLFEALKVAVEVDSWEFHGDRESFERDRRRRNELEAAGYLVLNFTWRQITEDPDWVVDCIHRALALRTAAMQNAYA